MSEKLTKRAADMLLNGATLLSEPCPYCSGVRVMKDGKALCVSCGREPERREIPQKHEQPKKGDISETLEKKLDLLSKELEQESNHEKQQDILKSINSILETLEKIKKKQ